MKIGTKDYFTGIMTVARYGGRDKTAQIPSKNQLFLHFVAYLGTIIPSKRLIIT